MKNLNDSLTNFDICQKTYEELNTANNLIYVLKEYLLSLELQSNYYDNSIPILNISKERNRYITLLSIIQEKIENIEQLNNSLENKLTQ